MDSLNYKLLGSVFAVFGIVGMIAAIAAIVAYAIFKQLGSKWLDNHFAERLEAFKHRQNLEVEDAKYRINRLFDRASKLHQYEYIHLPGAWAKLVEAFYDARASLGRGQQYATIQGEPDDTVRRHMEAHGHSSETVDWVMRSSERQKDYVRAVNHLRLRKAQASSDAFMNYLIANQIFIRPEISEKFDSLGMLLRMALSDREFELEFPGQHRSSLPLIKQFLDDGERKMDELQKVVRDRLADTIADPVGEAAP